jgi:phage shock protein C
MDTKRFFSLDRRHAKLFGVCSGLGKKFGIDPTFIRIAWVAVPLLTFVDFSTAALAYAAAGLIGFIGRHRADRGPDRRSDFDRMDDVAGSRTSIRDLSTTLDTNDRRMMAIDQHLNRHNDELAREIEALREDR